MKKIVLLAFVSMLILPMAVVIHFSVRVKAEPKTIYVDASNIGDPLQDGSLGHPFNKIQEGVDAASPGDKVFVFNGTYEEWQIILSKDNLSLVGESRDNTIIDGRGLGSILRINNAHNVTITGFTIRNSPGSVGIWLYYSTKNNISNNIITKCDSGIYSVFSNGNVIENNRISDSYYGIDLSSFSRENRISNNDVIGNTRGIALAHNNSRNEVRNNKIVQNTYGISISYDDGLIFGNQIINNSVGIYEDLYIGPAQGYRIFRNNFINNTKQIDLGNQSVNIWDNGLEGNYWSDYNGTDFNQDGIGDTSYIINGNNTDHYPLMGMFHSFKTSLGYYVNVISNSTIEDFTFFESNSTIKMYVSNMTTSQTFGFCRVCVPHSLMNPDEISVIIDDGQTPVLYHNYALHDNGTHRWIYFAYEHSTHEVLISDTTPPTISILSPENKTYTVNNIPLTFTVSEPTSWIGYSLGGQMNVTITGNTTLSALSEGSHSLRVYAKDTARKTGSSEIIYFTIETQQEEAFPTWILATIVIITVVGAALLIYFAKVKKTTEKVK